MNKEIKALIFDIGGVLMFYDHRIAARKMSKIINVNSKKIFQILNDNTNSFTQAYELGASRKTYWRIMARQLNVDSIPAKKFDEIWTTIFKPNRKIFSLAKKLKRKKYKIALISNIGSLHQKHLEKKYKLNKIFPVIIYSYKIKVRKPSPKIYKSALRKLNVKPDEVVFIDDRPENAKRAEKLGMHGIYFKNNKQAIKEINKLLK